MQPVVISPESVIDSVIPSIGEPCLCFVDSGELDVLVGNLMFYAGRFAFLKIKMEKSSEWQKFRH